MFTINIFRPSNKQWEVTANILGKKVVSTGDCLHAAMLAIEIAYGVARDKLAAEFPGRAA